MRNIEFYSNVTRINAYGVIDIHENQLMQQAQQRYCSLYFTVYKLKGVCYIFSLRGFLFIVHTYLEINISIQMSRCFLFCTIFNFLCAKMMLDILLCIILRVDIPHIIV